MRDEAVTVRLLEQTGPRVDEDDGEVGRGSARHHVPSVLDVPRGVGDDELPLGRGEVAVSHVNGDALLPLGAEAVGQQGQVGPVCAALGGGLLDAFELVLEDGLAVVQKATDQRALAVVDAACRDEAKESLCHGVVLFSVLRSSLLSSGPPWPTGCACRPCGHRAPSCGLRPPRR